MQSKLERNLKLGSGLVIAFFLVLHLLNAALGIASLAAMDALGKILFGFWSIPVFTLLLYSAFAIHIAMTFVSLYRRRSLRMPLWNWLQTGLGLALPILLVNHIMQTRGVNLLLDIKPNYSRVVTSFWTDPAGVAQQIVLLILAWTHMAMGIHYWLRHRAGYSRWVPVLYPLCLIIPLLAVLGFTRAGFESMEQPVSPPASVQADSEPYADIGEPANGESGAGANNAVREGRQLLTQRGKQLLSALGLLLLLLLIARFIRGFLNNKQSGFSITHTLMEKPIKAQRGQTVLEALRISNVQHASVCGGRGRCTTCRIRVSDDGQVLPEPTALEAAALKRVGAESNVRLACQLQPDRDIAITPLLHPGTAALEVNSRSSVAGHEQQVACMFVDMRGSTSLGEQKLPYDVVFILNQFFNQLAEALNSSEGHYATFNGDGLMALYGLDSDLETGCRNALKGAIDIRRRIGILNVWLAAELKQPLRIGMGIHCGEAIVGTMGPPDAPIISAIGDTVNITARLEALTKEYKTDLLISESVLQKAGVDFTGLSSHSVQVRGREDSLAIYNVGKPAILNDWVENFSVSTV
jgi:adenylate cyclase